WTLRHAPVFRANSRNCRRKLNRSWNPPKKAAAPSQNVDGGYAAPISLKQSPHEFPANRHPTLFQLQELPPSARHSRHVLREVSAQVVDAAGTGPDRQFPSVGDAGKR